MLNFITKQVKYRLDNTKFYSIKLLVDTSLQKIPYCNELFKKYGKSQILFTFYVLTIVNNMFYSNKNINHGYRKLIIDLGKFEFIKDWEGPLESNKCLTHDNNKISCSDDIWRLFIRNYKNLMKLYLPIYAIASLARKKFNTRDVFMSAFRSSSFLVYFAFIYRLIVCSLYNIKNHQDIIDSQAAITFGSLAFQIESDERKKMINKYMLSLYLHDLTSQCELRDKNVWNILFCVSIIYSLRLRGVLPTLLSIVF